MVAVVGGLWPVPRSESQCGTGGAQCAPRQSVLWAQRGRGACPRGREKTCCIMKE